MSILLDALRKSEQQKKLGTAPDIHGAEPMIYEPRRPGWLLPAVVAGIIVLLVTGSYMAWRTFLQDGQEPPVTGVNSTAQTSSGQTSQTGVVPSEAPPDLSGTPAVGPLSPVDEVASEANTAGALSGAGAKPAPRADTRPRSPVESLSGYRPYQAASGAAVPAAAADPAASSPPVAGSPPGAATTDAGTISDSSSARSLLPSPAEKTVAEPVSVQNSTAPATGDTRDDNGVISYWQLPETVRNQLPQFKITVLVYDEVPANRFILMGGKRYKVGDMFGNDVRLLTILRDRAIFRYNAYRFFVTQR